MTMTWETNVFGIQHHRTYRNSVSRIESGNFYVDRFVVHTFFWIDFYTDILLIKINFNHYTIPGLHIG